ncbi:MAG TPA: histidine phosphatase family protein [Candidatus Eremiobacteraceae bacterium]|nr:histidine phosphatase family protein [Candidatus Eremiobacteraceae bacterium]
MQVLLVRHGETTWNLEGRYQGRKDPPLSHRGLLQAQALAQRLHAEPIAAVFSSPLKRAAQTAQVCADALGLEVTLDSRLLEISHGAWEGKLRSEIAQSQGEMLALWHEHPERVRFPGGEGLADVRDRVTGFWVDLAQKHSGMCLIVTHDVIVRLAVLAAQDRPLADFQGVAIDNAALNRFAMNAGKFSLKTLNEAGFLGDLRSRLAEQAR